MEQRILICLVNILKKSITKIDIKVCTTTAFVTANTVTTPSHKWFGIVVVAVVV